MVSAEYDYLYKVIVIGDSGVGKSSVVVRFSDDLFNKNHASSIGVDFKIKTIEQDGKTIKLQLWDTAGQERYRPITASYYRGALGLIYIFDLSDRVSFNNIRLWHQQSTKEEGSQGVLVANKSDLSERRQVSHQEAMLLAEDLGMIYIEVSALSGHNVSDMFDILVRQIRCSQS